MRKFTIYNLQFTIQRGFTLIEIIVVLAIIAMLSGLAMTNLASVIQRSRDSQRKADLRQIQSALELYRADQGSYPDTIIFTATCNSQLAVGVFPNQKIYMQSTPCDPVNIAANGFQYQYSYNTGNKGYCLRACLEKTNDPQKDATNNYSVNGCTFTPTSLCGQNGVNSWSYTLLNP